MEDALYLVFAVFFSPKSCVKPLGFLFNINISKSNSGEISENVLL